MKMLHPHFGCPTNMLVSASYMPRRRGPGKTRDRSLPHIDKVLEMFPYGMAIAQIMQLCYQTIEELFIGCTPDLTYLKRFYVS
jgi:hypothetical protein